MERSIDHKVRWRNFDARNERIETGQWLRIARINVVLKEDTENAINGKQKDSGRVEIIVDSSTMGISAQNRHQKSAPSSEPLAQKDGRSASRRKSLRGWSPRKFAGQSCRDYMKGNCTRSFCDYWHPPEVSSIKLNRDSNSVISVRFHTQESTWRSLGAQLPSKARARHFYPSRTIWHFSRKISSAETR